MSKSLGANIVKLLSSRAAAQVIAFVATPVIARLFSPNSFGTLQIFRSMALVIGAITCLGYERSIPLGRSRKEATVSFTLSLFFAVVFASAALVFVSLVIGRISQWFKAPELSIFLWLLPIAILMAGLGNSLRYWVAREEKFGTIAWSDLSRVLVNTLITIAWGLIIGASTTALFAGYFVGTGFGILVLFLFSGRRLVSSIKNAELSLTKLWIVAKHHKKFPIFDIWSRLLNSLSLQLPAVILGLHFSTTVVGYYSLGQRFIRLPMGMLGKTIGHVFFPAAAREYDRTGTLSKMVSNMFKRLAQIGILPMVILAFLGAPLFGSVFGEGWIEAGLYAQILSAHALFQFMISPLSTVFIVLQRQGTLLAFSAALLSSRALALLLVAKMHGPRTTLLAYTIVSAIGYVFVLNWVLRNSSISLKRAIEILLKYTISSCLSLLPTVCLAWFGADMSLVLASLVPTAVIYLLCLYRFDVGFRNIAAGVLGKIPVGRACS